MNCSAIGLNCMVFRCAAAPPRRRGSNARACPALSPLGLAGHHPDDNPINCGLRRARVCPEAMRGPSFRNAHESSTDQPPPWTTRTTTRFSPASTG
ncbi:protein of unknown function [Azospirillum baldaniorum]|uniref:Uncharacterized protein n=1 Tax=Azospirillum baldaniorum TaxID=1064539 RepID=A0A9P1JMW9_9PROT|nr:protein of unknown function [Azospirillum baldaniorum]